MKRLMFITSTFLFCFSTHAANPWLKKMAPCQRVAHKHVGSGIVQLGNTFEPSVNESLINTFQSLPLMFVGTHEDKAGLWIVTENNAYFADLTGAPGKTKIAQGSIWDLNLIFEGTKSLRLKAKYMKTANRRLLLNVDMKHPIDLTNTGDTKTSNSVLNIDTKKFLTKDLKSTIINQVQQALAHFNKVYGPGTFEEEEKKYHLERQIEQRRPFADQFNPRTSKPENSLKMITTNRKRDILNLLETCRTAIEGSKDTGALSPQVLLTIQYIQRNLKDPYPGEVINEIGSEIAL